jgi:hypothetical protein
MTATIHVPADSKETFNEDTVFEKLENVTSWDGRNINEIAGVLSHIYIDRFNEWVEMISLINLMR